MIYLVQIDLLGELLDQVPIVLIGQIELIILFLFLF
jgi:hypothetical protein